MYWKNHRSVNKLILWLDNVFKRQVESLQEAEKEVIPQESIRDANDPMCIVLLFTVYWNTAVATTAFHQGHRFLQDNFGYVWTFVSSVIHSQNKTRSWGIRFFWLCSRRSAERALVFFIIFHWRVHNCVHQTNYAAGSTSYNARTYFSCLNKRDLKTTRAESESQKEQGIAALGISLVW